LMRPHSPDGERGRESLSRHGALHLLNGGGFHQRPEVPVDRLLLGVDRLGKTAQKHRRSGDVLASLSELWGIVSSIHDVALDLTGVTTGAAHRVTRAWRSVLRRARRRRWRLVLPPLSQVFARALAHEGGPPYEGPKGCESVETPLPPVTVPERPP